MISNANPPRYEEITVSGGTGSKDVTHTGICLAIGIIPPNESAVYSVDFADSQSFGIWGKTGLSGSSTQYVDIQLYRTFTITISNATVDGTYKMKLWFRF